MNGPKPLPDEIPFEIEMLGDDRAVVRFAEICDHERTDQWRLQLTNLVAESSEIVCDLSLTETIVSGWLRLLETLTVRAEESGKRFILASVRQSIRESADVMGVGKRLEFVRSVADGWES